MRFRLRTIRTFAVLCRLQRLHYTECFAESSELSVIRLLTLSSAVRFLCSILWSPSTCWDWLSWRRPVRSSSLCLRGNRSCPSSPCWWRRCTARWAWLTRSCVSTSACCGGTRSPNSCEAASRTWEVAGSIPDTPTPTLTAHHTDWLAEVSVPLSNSILLFGLFSFFFGQNTEETRDITSWYLQQLQCQMFQHQHSTRALISESVIDRSLFRLVNARWFRVCLNRTCSMLNYCML